MRITCLTAILVLHLFSSESALRAGSDTPDQQDMDKDGLPDTFEQEILDRFLPRFMVSETECAGKPAEFKVELENPSPAALNGTIYGQVFLVKPSSAQGALLEVHYYHLWVRDCGDFGHSLDPEYVSVLLRSRHGHSSAKEWKAVYWYAAAHEGTWCDASNGTRASAIGAETKGATVWISSGKHASFLSRELCRRVGCGGDRCERMKHMPTMGPINLGEPGRPINGADWTASEAWSLVDKMGSGFDDSRLTRFQQLPRDSAAFTNRSLAPAKAFLLGGNRLFGALAISNAKADAFLSKAGRHTSLAVDKALNQGETSIRESIRTFQRWLGIGRQSTVPPRPLTGKGQR